MTEVNHVLETASSTAFFSSLLKVSGRVRRMGVMRNLVDQDSVTRFKERYRKLSSIEGYWGGDPNRLRTNLQARGVFPVWNPADANAEFYRIADI